MSAVLQASGYARRLVESEAKRAGGVKAAIPIVARRVKAPAGAVWSLLFRLPKQISADLRDSLEAAVVGEIQREIRALENELAAITSGARRCDLGTIEEVETGLARLKSLLRGEAAHG